MGLLLLFLTYIIIENVSSCSTMADCSYNGICKNSVCECRPQWYGQHCASLNIIPGVKRAGLYSSINGSLYTTWGGGAVYDNSSKLWHMVAAEISEQCGMSVWLSNSRLVHATSKTYDGIYTRVEVPKGGQLFSHEPNIVKALDTGEFVVYYTHNYPPATFDYPCYNCSEGESINCPEPPNSSYFSRNWDVKLPTKMIYTSNISDNSKWSDVIDLDYITPDEYIDSNFCATIYPNGSLVGILRNDNSDNAKTYNLITSTHWKNNGSYERHQTLPYDNDNGHTIAQYGEDPFIWHDPRYHVLHTLWHYTYNGNDMPLGLHAFSEDNGKTWHAFLDFSYPKIPFRKQDYPAEWAYNNTAYYTDGTKLDFDAAERPHLIFADDGYTPLALTNGARLPNGFDYSVTLLRPIYQG